MTSELGQETEDDIEDENDDCRIVPADTCTIFSAEGATSSSDCEAVLVNRFWRLRDGSPSTLLLWLPAQVYEEDLSDGHSNSFDVDIACYHIVLTVSMHRPAPSTLTDLRKTVKVSCQLEAGTTC